MVPSVAKDARGQTLNLPPHFENVLDAALAGSDPATHYLRSDGILLRKRRSFLEGEAV